MKKWKLYAIPVLIGLAAAGLFLISQKTVTLVVDGETKQFNTHAMTVGRALQTAGLTASSQDILQPPEGTVLWGDAVITLEHARPVTIISPALGGSVTFLSHERIPARLGALAGLEVSPSDLLLWNGVRLPVDQPLPAAPEYVLQFKKASTIEIEENGQSIRLASTGATVGAALWEAGIRLSASDNLSAPLESPLPEKISLKLTRAIPVHIKIGDVEISTSSSAPTAGQALAEAGIALQGLDYMIPSEEQPLPLDGILQVFRVREEITLQQTVVPYKSEYVENSEVELDQRKLVEAGQYGIEVSRLRTRYENGQEISKQIESQWTAVEPKPEKIGYGTKIVLHTIDTPAGPLEYWRAVPVYATSYSPCRSGTSKCYFGSSSGRPVQRGVIGVTRQWYSLLANQPVYVPGYGTGVIADVGGGVPGKYWIDLGFTDEDFEPWHQNTVLYFLTPVPASVPWILP